MPMLKVRYQWGNNNIKKEGFMTSQRMLENSLAWGPQNKARALNIPKLLHGGHYDQELILHGIHQGLCHLTIVSPVKICKLSIM